MLVRFPHEESGKMRKLNHGMAHIVLLNERTQTLLLSRYIFLMMDPSKSTRPEYVHVHQSFLQDFIGMVEIRRVQVTHPSGYRNLCQCKVMKKRVMNLNRPSQTNYQLTIPIVQVMRILMKRIWVILQIHAPQNSLNRPQVLPQNVTH